MPARRTRLGRGQYKQAGGQHSSGAGLGILTAGILGGDKSQGFQENQPVSPEIQAPTYTGPQQYYSPSGQVTGMPTSDTRNFLQRLIRQPNVSQDINTQTVLGNVANQQAMQALREKTAFEDTRFPTELKQKGQIAEQEAKIKTDADTAREIAQYKLNREQGKIPIPLSAPLESGDYPYDQPIESPEIERSKLQAQGLTYLPYNPAGIEGNAKLAEEKSMSAYRAAQATKMGEPEYHAVGNVLFENGKPSYQVPESKWEKVFQINPTTKMPEETYKQFGGGKPINLQPKVLGNVYGNQGGAAISPPESAGFNPTKMSHSTQNFVMKVGDNGRPMEVPSQAEPPKVEPSALYDYGVPQAAPTHRLRPGGNPQRLQEQIAAETSPVNEPSEQEKLIRRLNQILQGTGRY